MAPTTGTASLRADSARVRARMLAAAREMLAAGDEELPMNAVAKAAGVGVGTMYRHFPSRQALLESLAAESYATLVEQARAAAADPDVAAGLTGLLRATLSCQLTDPSLATVLSAPEFACAETVELSRELNAAALRVLERARAAGVVRPDVTADDLRRLMCGVQHAVRSGADDGTAAARYLDILVRGLHP
jgi:AcrR family transcriptional regulator